MAKIDERSIRCSFCGKRQDQVKRILSGPNVYICDECVDLCSSLLHEDMYETQEPAFQPGDKLPTPKEIKAYMDGYIIGQEDAKADPLRLRCITTTSASSSAETPRWSCRRAISC